MPGEMQPDSKALQELDADFNAVYPDLGRDSIPPEKLLGAQLLVAFYTIRSERQLMEQLDYNLLYSWFMVPAFLTCLSVTRVASNNNSPLISHRHTLFTPARCASF